MLVKIEPALLWVNGLEAVWGVPEKGHRCSFLGLILFPVGDTYLG